jgi:hypothetical protein
MSNIACVRNSLRWLTCMPLLAACASDTVPLGGGDLRPPLPAGSRCSESPVLTGAVHVSNQAELAALAGCEEIEGDLIIEVFQGADVSPLASLRTVGGDFQLGAYPGSDRDNIEGDEIDELQRTFQLGLRYGYLPSLAGLESLERTGNLQIAHISAPSLSVFANLRNIGSHGDVSRAGWLRLEDNAGLVDLRGLENARGIGDLILLDNPAVESLDGLVEVSTLQNLNILNSPQLSELGQLASIGSLNTLILDNVGVRNLDDLQHLGEVTELSLTNNPELEHVDSLSHFYGTSLVFQDNPRLVRLPAFDRGSVDTLLVIGNAELSAISLALPTPSSGGLNLQGVKVEVRPHVLEITENPKLQTISLAAGLRLAQYVAIYENAALTSIDFGSLQDLDTLLVNDNPRLTQAGRGELQTIDSLIVTGNPLLSTVELEGVHTFEKKVLRNAPAPAQ